MSYVKGLRCRECGAETPVAPLHVCETCFGPLEVQSTTTPPSGAR